MVVYGYARVSTTDQDLSIQLEALDKAGCKIVRSDQKTGITLDCRSGLQTILDCGGKGRWRVSRRPRPLAFTRGARPIDVAKVMELQATEMGATEIAKELRIGRASVYRIIGPTNGKPASAST